MQKTATGFNVTVEPDHEFYFTGDLYFEVEELINGNLEAIKPVLNDAGDDF